ncbi:MAG: hypothetical protein AAFV25_19375, partial [Bacteroidota bacterium]
VPDFVFTKVNSFTGELVEVPHKEQILKGYPFKYQLISTDDLNERILNDENGFYYCVLVKSGTYKIISILNSKTGDLIYTHAYIPMPPFIIKSKDFKHMASLM